MRESPGSGEAERLPYKPPRVYNDDKRRTVTVNGITYEWQCAPDPQEGSRNVTTIFYNGTAVYRYTGAPMTTLRPGFAPSSGISGLRSYYGDREPGDIRLVRSAFVGLTAPGILSTGHSRIDGAPRSPSGPGMLEPVRSSRKPMITDHRAKVARKLHPARIRVSP